MCFFVLGCFFFCVCVSVCGICITFCKQQYVLGDVSLGPAQGGESTNVGQHMLNLLY